MFGFKRKRKQYCLVLTEDSRILETELLVRKGYCVDDKYGEAWGLLPEALVPKKRTGTMYMIANERSATPMSLNGDNHQKWTKEVISAIAAESADESLNKVYKKSLTNKLASAVKFSIIAFAILICVVVIFGLISTGKLHLPSF